MRTSKKGLSYASAVIVIVALVVGVLALTGCLKAGSDEAPGTDLTKGTPPVSGTPAAPGATAKAPGGKETVLTIYVPCAFASAATKIKPLFEAANPGVRLSLNVENVEVLAPKIMKGEKPDVFMCIGDKEVEKMAAAKMVAYQKNMCFTTLALVVPASNPAKVTTLADLTKPAVKSIAIGEPDTSIGFYAKQTLVQNKVWDKIQGKLLPQQYPVMTLRMPAMGKVQASIAFGACFRAKEGQEKQMVAKIKLMTDFQDKYCLSIACPAAAIVGAPNQQLAKAYVDFLSTDACQQILADAGFMKLSDPKCFTKAGAAKPAKAGAKAAVPAGT